MATPPREFPPDVPQSGSFIAGLEAMGDRAFLGSQRYRGQQWRAERKGCHPDVIEFERALVGRFEKLGVPLFAHEFLRSSERQSQLFLDGFSKAPPGESAHEFGMGVDIVHGIKGWNLDKKQWGLIGHVGLEIVTQKGLRLVWGGDWKFYDPAHWELDGWKELKGKFPWPTK